MRPRIAVLAAAAVLSTSGCWPGIAAQPAPPSPASSTPTPPPPAAVLPLDQARAQLAALPIRSEDTGAHYRRTDWGDWAYDPATKCSTRERVLRRDGTGVQVDEQCRPHCPARPPAPACWTSRYDNAAVYEAARLQVDHVVALAQSARSGARNWTRAQRETFANDLDNLVAVSAASNQSKNDADADVGRWRPPAGGSWCWLATTVILIKTRYQLHVDQAEHDTLAAMLRACPRETGQP